jgi:hypothetical protein
MLSPISPHLIKVIGAGAEQRLCERDHHEVTAKAYSEETKGLYPLGDLESTPYTSWPHSALSKMSTSRRKPGH